MTYVASGKYWRFHVGERFVNRVTLHTQRHGTIRMTWVEGGKLRAKYTGTRDKFRAIIMAEEKAVELLAKRKKPTYRPESEIMAIRLDLLRVARETGKPDGVAPQLHDYEKLGRFSVSRTLSAFAGYRQVTTYYMPVDTWSVAMRKFGFKPAGYWRNATERDLLKDLRRVALMLGRPLEMPPSDVYNALGNYAHTTVRGRFPGMGWPEIGDRAGLQTPAKRRALSALIRGKRTVRQAA